MILSRFIDESTGCASYLVGDAARGLAVVIDPGRDVEPYLEAAEEHGLRIGHAIAMDSQALLLPLYELKKRVGAAIHGIASGPPLFSVNTLLPGCRFDLGSLRFQLTSDPAGGDTLQVYDLEGDGARPLLVTGTSGNRSDRIPTPALRGGARPPADVESVER